MTSPDGRRGRRITRREERPADAPVRAIGYLRVSTQEQAESGAGMAAQRAAITAEAGRHGWTLEWAADAGRSAKNLDRPALLAALDQLDRGDADVLVVSKLDRLSRSVLDFGAIVARAKKRGWALVCMDLGMDMTTPMGRMVASVVVSLAEFEREIIGQRTKDALAAKAAEGIRVGRPPSLDPATVTRIAHAYTAGATYTRIADDLTRDAIPRTGGRAGPWTADAVRAALRTKAARQAPSDPAAAA